MSKVTAKSVICEGIIKGRSVEAILKNVAKKVPTSKADASHITYYANTLLKAGEIKQEQRDKYVKTRGRPGGKAAAKKAPAKKAADKKSSKNSTEKKTSKKK